MAENVDLRAFEDDLKNAIHQKWSSFQSAFRAFDRDSNGYVTEENFIRTLRNFNYNLSDEDIHRMMRRFDKNCDGVISYKEFVQVLTEKRESFCATNMSMSMIDPDGKAQEVDDALIRLKDKLDDRFYSLREAFLALDTNRTGNITRTEFSKTLDKF